VFSRWNEAMSIVTPTGTRNHAHGELATSSVVELRAQSPKG
jgi:hypothetical protein